MPKTVLAAILLLGLSLVVGLVQIVLFVASANLPAPTWLLYSVSGAIYAALGFLVFLAARGKDWARITYAVILVLGLMRTAVVLPALIRSFESNGLAIAVLAAKITALVLL